MRKKKKYTLLAILLLLSHASVFFSTWVYRSLDDQSYYSSSVNILLTETISALRANDGKLLHRITDFQEKQKLTYESRSSLLENVREFQEKGREIRNKNN